jgi:hypothetical protein
MTGIAVPYLVAVPDPYDTLSPDHDWGPLLLSPAGAGRALGLGGPLQSVVQSPGSGHVSSVTAASADRQVTLTGQQVETDLGLRSTFFDVGVLALTPPAGAAVPGSAVTLSGKVEGLAGVTLEAKPAGGPWQTLATVVPGPTGSFSITVSPHATTLYRLAAGIVRGALITVAVAAT